MDALQEQLLRSALSLAALEMRVFPLKPGTKKPAFTGWKEIATTDEARIRATWAHDAYNIGVAMGGGWLGLDIDVKKGKQGLANAEALGVGWSGFVVHTPSGGRHVYYTGAPDVGNPVGRLGDGLDVRSGGGFLVGPGSVIEGVAYTLASANAPEVVLPAIIQRCVAPVERVELDKPVQADQPDNVARAIEYLLTAAPLAVEGAGGDHTTFTVFAHLKDMGVIRDMAVEIAAEHWLPRCTMSWSLEDATEWLRVKAENAFNHTQKPVGITTPEVDFLGVHVEPPPKPVRAPTKWFDHGDSFDPNQTWLFYQMLPTTGVCVLSALPQAGKSFLILELARCGATGKTFFTIEPDERFGTLLVYTGTEGSGLALRLAALGEPERLPISAMSVANLGARDALSELLEDLKTKAAWILETFGVPVKLIVFETLAASGLLQDENDNAQAAQAIANLGTISLAMQALVLTSHHPSKDGKSARGASAITGNADYVIEIDRRGQESVRRVSLTKARGAEQRSLGTFSLVPVDLGEDPRGRPITSMVLSTGERAASVDKKAAHSEQLIQSIGLINPAHFEPLRGSSAVSEEILKEQFLDLLPPSYRKTKSNGTRAFGNALAWCEQMGAIEVVPHDGIKYVIRRGVVANAA